MKYKQAEFPETPLHVTEVCVERGCFDPSGGTCLPCGDRLDMAWVRPLRAGGLPLPHQERLPRPCASKPVFSGLFVHSHAHVVPGTDNIFLFHLSLTLCFLIFFLQRMELPVLFLELIFKSWYFWCCSLILFRI